MASSNKFDRDMQKALKAFLERRHPDYDSKLEHWDFLDATYQGGRDYFTEENIFKYVKEGETEFNNRMERAYRFNHSREVIDLVQKYIFKPKITRNHENAPEEVKEFWENATLSGLDISQFMKMAGAESSKYGCPWIFADTTKKPDVISVADAKEKKARCYAYIVRPQDVLDMGFNEDGVNTWVLVRESVRDDSDPIFSTGEVYERFRLWEQNSWTLFEIEERKGSTIVHIVDEQETNLGRVPGFPLWHVIGDNQYTAPGLIDDIAYLDRAVTNYLSNLDAIIQDQTFSQLAMPAQALLPGSDEYKQLLEMGTKRIFVYDGEGGAAPVYLSPDPKQAGVIITVINKIINEIYHTIGMAGERTKQDNATGIDNSSGVAKAYDFERMNSLLTSKAGSLENAENKLVELVLAWHSKPALEEELVKYPETFDVRSLFDEFTIGERLLLIDAPDDVRREQMKQIIDKLFPRLSKELREKMESGLEDWPPKIDMTITDSVGGTAQPAKFPGKGSVTRGKNPQTAKRQGQNNTGKPE